MILHSRRFQQFLPISISEAWDFFSRPENLNEITPDDMEFEILTKDLPKMHKGMIVEYKVSPFPMVKMGWVTEITHVEEQRMFVDEQRFGTYSFWHHQHIFEPIEGGVLMTDILHYKVPFGIVGNLVNALVVRNKVNSIFEYRTQMLQNKFGTSMLLPKQD